MALKSSIIILLLIGLCSSDKPNRIVGGSPTDIQSYPSMVQVEFRGQWNHIWSQSCAGSILNSLFILTAAHCFEGGLWILENRRIRAGATERGIGGQVVGVANRFNHPEYQKLTTYDSDISVILLEAPVVYTPVVQQGAIIPQGFEVPDNAPVVQAGWGSIGYLEVASPVLLDVTAYTINRQLCADRYATLNNPINVTHNMICSGLLDVGGADACNGDSGGPMYYGNVIVGIVSWSYQCADAYYPGVSTAVSPFTDWIVETVQGAHQV